MKRHVLGLSLLFCLCASVAVADISKPFQADENSVMGFPWGSSHIASREIPDYGALPNFPIYGSGLYESAPYFEERTYEYISEIVTSLDDFPLTRTIFFFHSTEGLWAFMAYNNKSSDPQDVKKMHDWCVKAWGTNYEKVTVKMNSFTQLPALQWKKGFLVCRFYEERLFAKPTIEIYREDLMKKVIEEDIVYNYSAFKNEPMGFRQVQWGAKPQKKEGFSLIEEPFMSVGTEKRYRRANEKMSIGSLPLKSVEYAFDGAFGLWQVEIVLADNVPQDAAMRLAHILVEQYGVEPKEASSALYWWGPNTTVTLKTGMFGGSDDLRFTSTKIERQIREREEQVKQKEKEQLDQADKSAASDL